MKPAKHNQTRSLKTRLTLSAAAVASCFALSVAANPVAPILLNGSASFDHNGKTLTVTNTNGTIIRWDQFSIAAGERTHFQQTAASAAVLNLVKLGAPLSEIYGTLSSNGRVWLINPAGIMVGAGGRVDVAGFVASTLNVTNADFLANRLNFGTAVTSAGTGSVINRGEIVTPQGGSVYLVGGTVTNEGGGIITTPKGETILAAGSTVSLIDSATPGVKVEITGAAGNATNLGTITAEAGRIGIAGVIVRNSGTLNASSVVKEGGRIFLRATQKLELAATSKLRANGAHGGEITAIVADNGVLRGEFLADGEVSAQGNGDTGSGGFVETSAAKLKISDSFRVATGGGEWLIDPNDYTIAASGGDITGSTLAANLAGNNVTIQSSQGSITGNGDIFVNDTVSWNSLYSLLLLAERNISVDAPVQNSGSGGFNLVAGWNPASGTGNSATAINGIGAITATAAVSAGSVNWKAGAGMTLGAGLATTGAITLAAGGNVEQLSSSIISNTAATGADDISISGADITLRQVQSHRNVLLNASGDVHLLGAGSGGFIDDTYFVYNLPFTFHFFGTAYTQAYITTNGLITFGSGTSDYTDSLADLGSYRAIAPAWNDWTLQASTGRDIHIGLGGGKVTVLWDVGRYPSTTAAARFEAVLSPITDTIRFNYGASSTLGDDVTIGLSDGIGNVLSSQLMSLPNFASTSINNLRSTVFTPNGSGGYNEALRSSNTTLSTPGPVSGSALLGQGSGTVVAAVGTLGITAGGLIDAPSQLSAQTLQFVSHGGALFTGNNQFDFISASHNFSSGDVSIYNSTAPGTLTVTGLRTDTGDLVLDNTGGIVLAGIVSAAGSLDVVAHSPITVTSGASISAGGNLSLVASSSSSSSTTDVLTIAGSVTSTGGNIDLTGGSGIGFAATASIAAPAGSVGAASPFGSVSVDPGARLSAANGVTLTSFSATNPVVVIETGSPINLIDTSVTQRLTTDLNVEDIFVNNLLELTLTITEEKEIKDTFGVEVTFEEQKKRAKVGRCG